jgi:hypothetical protein
MRKSRNTPSLRLVAGIVAACLSLAAHADDSAIRINQLQYIGSHNSYHAGMAPGEVQVWKATAPKIFAALDYRHPPLPQQFDDGVRQIELDIYGDAKGGRYAHPVIVQQVAKAGLPADPPFADDAVMRKPGFKVMHVQDLDQRSTCQPLVACLTQVREWSRAHPRHLPMFVLLETEAETLHAQFPTVIPEPWDVKALNALEAEITSVFPRNEYISPDDVRGKSATLNEAIRTHGWPTVEAARGKIIFLLDQRSVGPNYLAGHPSLRGRVLFTNAKPGDPDAAFSELNDGPADAITSLVKEGYLIRTRTDANLVEAHANDTRRRDQMMASGAQILSSDFPHNEPDTNGYVVGFPGGAVARCNPQFALVACPADAVGE